MSTLQRRGRRLSWRSSPKRRSTSTRRLRLRGLPSSTSSTASRRCRRGWATASAARCAAPWA
eukprot:SM000101S09307  [mRNA]  locus=s101:515469:515814:- [translate_table: standard]